MLQYQHKYLFIRITYMSVNYTNTTSSFPCVSGAVRVRKLIVLHCDIL